MNHDATVRKGDSDHPGFLEACDEQLCRPLSGRDIGSLDPIVSGACTRLRRRLRGAAVENHRGGPGLVTGLLSKHLAWCKVMNKHASA